MILVPPPYYYLNHGPEHIHSVLRCIFRHRRLRVPILNIHLMYFRIMSTAIMAAAPKASEKIGTAPFDPRFPNQNQTKYCYQSFLDFHRCQKVKGSNYEPCNYFKRVYSSMCPNEWVDKWEGQLDAGTFAGRI
uniref:Cytochrome c oxidase subunit 6B1 n=1 Tax=Lygus hesperus TaxID=30085 RepID=A0A0A9YQ11_LYGHE